jgi:Flp pilus assembly protein TadG
MKSMSKIWFSARRSALTLIGDRRGVAAIEFAMIVPIMLVMFFGTVEFSSGVAVDRKVTLIARTLSDLTSQSPPTAPNSPLVPAPNSPSAAVDDNSLLNIFNASISIVRPYSPTPTKATISEIYVDSNQTAKIKWSKAAIIAPGATQATLTASSRNTGDVITLPATLSAKQTYVILSEVSYLYTPTIGYVMKTGVTLSDVAYTRPRQVVCVIYNSLPTADGTCPTP